jgi:hypothetical protein
MPASAATGWSVSCRVGLLLSHWSSAPFHGALKHALRPAVLLIGPLAGEGGLETRSHVFFH